MIIRNKNNIVIEPEPNKKEICNLCNSEIISKCGLVNIWHWSHKNNSDCDTWSEPESEWHIKWKSKVPIENREIIFSNHRADILINNRIIELQNSPISAEEIIERESVYKNMIWLFNGIELYDRFTINKKVNENNNTYYTFRWKHPKRTLVFCKKEIYLDLGIDCIFQIKKMYTEPCRGWGIVYSHADFCKKFGLNTN